MASEATGGGLLLKVATCVNVMTKMDRISYIHINRCIYICIYHVYYTFILFHIFLFIY